MTPIVELTDVSFYYHSTRVLHDISFTLRLLSKIRQ